MKFESFTEKDKIDILLNILNERYHAAHQMRERSLKFAMWILGFVAVAVPWLLFQRGLCLSQKVALTVLITMLGAATFLFVRAIHVGFNKNWEVIIKLEEALGCYEKNLFINSIQLFPEEYRNIRKISSRSHFSLIYIWIIMASIVTVISIWESF